MELRKYQEEARESIQQEWAEGRKKTLLVLPTGCGKTIVFAKVIEDRVRMGERVLVLAHRSELLDQASDKLFKSTGLQTRKQVQRVSAHGIVLSLDPFKPCSNPNASQNSRKTTSIRLWWMKLIIASLMDINVCSHTLIVRMC